MTEEMSPVLSAERRWVTIVFCDLVGSTHLSLRLDPEEVQRIHDSYRETCKRAAAKFDGRVTEFAGDGVLMAFGYPYAHEHDAMRAVYAALELVRTVSSVEVESGKFLEVRIGIATGLVVVEPTRDGRVFMHGKPPTLAARLKELAEPNQVLIDAGTHSVTLDDVQCLSLGQQRPKGFEDFPEQVWKVVGVRGGRRFSSSNLTRFVNRRWELEELRDRWSAAKGGIGQAVIISGEAGIGKSRIADQMLREVTAEGCKSLLYQCSPIHTNSALLPIIGHIEQACGFVAGDSAEEKFKKLEAYVESSGARAQDLQVFALLLSLRADDGESLERDPHKLREATYEALLHQIRSTADQGARLILIEDVHWADPTTVELCRRLIEQVENLPVLLLISARPEFPETYSWSGLLPATCLELKPLDARDTRAIVEGRDNEFKLPTNAITRIVTLSDGIPLNAEELTRATIDTGLVPSVPETLTASLTARLDNLTGTAREAALIGAAIGPEFSYELLELVWPSSHDNRTQELDSALFQLMRSDLVEQVGSSTAARYCFRHALFQEAAYKTLVREKRFDLHKSIARVLCADVSGVGSRTRPEIVARHCREAGMTEAAIPYWTKAARNAARRSSHREAMRHFESAIDALDELSDTPERQRQKVEHLLGLGAVKMAGEGFASDGVREIYTRAAKLAQTLGEPPDLYVPSLSGLQLNHLVRGEHLQAKQLGEQCLQIASETEDVVYELEAHRHLGAVLFWLGEARESVEHLRKVEELYDEVKHQELKFLYGSDPKAGSLMFRALSLTLLNETDEADERAGQGLEHAQKLSHKHTKAYALLCYSMLHAIRDEFKMAGKMARETIALCAEHAIPFWLHWAKVIEGRALVEDGEGRRGLERMHEGREGFKSIGAGVAQTFFLASFASAYARVGQVDQSLSYIEEAFRVSRSNHEGFYTAELQRLKGDFLRAKGASRDEVDQYYEAAVASAKKGDMKFLELRAADSRRLWRETPRRTGKKRAV